MEKQVNEIINIVMKSKNLSSDDLNTIIRLHKTISHQKFKYQINRGKLIDGRFVESDDFIFSDKEETTVEVPINESYIFERQIKRLEMTLRDKLKQINVYLKDEYLDNLENILFYRSGKPDIKDLRFINKNEIAIIRENSIQLGDFSHNADRLSAGMDLTEEAYLHECSKTGEEPECYDPRTTFSSFYEKMDNKINDLKETLGIANRDVVMYFDRDLDSFYFENFKSFGVILTELPNTIEIYEVDATQDKWVPKRINGESVKDWLDRIDFTLLEEDFLLTDSKKRYKGRFLDGKITAFDIEMVLDKFKQVPFSLEALINTYNNLFNDNNCMSEENESAINRLKYITAERYVEQGFEYEKAFNYTETIFQTIQEYKKQIMSAINGENKFPEDSLIGTVKKLEYPTN